MTYIQSSRFDDATNAFFSRQLEYIKTKTYDIEYPPSKALTLLPMSTQADEGASTITYRSYDRVGRAQLIGDYADDLPRVDISGQEFTSDILEIGCSYGYSFQEIRAAQKNNFDLSAKQAVAARNAIDQLINKMAWFGDSSHTKKINGMLNNPGVPVATVPSDGSGSSTKWADKTPDQILRDMNDMIATIHETTLGVENPNTVLLPIAQYSLIARTPRSSTSDTTILQYFKDNNPDITTVDRIPELKGAGSGGTDVILMYDKNPDKLSLEIPMPFTQHTPIEKNLGFTISCEARIGGVLMYYPLSVSIGEGI